jgi:hypothetical protein
LPASSTRPSSSPRPDHGPAGAGGVALQNVADWDRILAVLLWFRQRPRSGLYLRQLDIAGVDTKFIETRKPLLSELLDVVLKPETDNRNFEARYGLLSKPSQIRFRILDERLAIQGLTDLAVPAREFAGLDLPVERVFITENEINGLAFPAVPGIERCAFPDPKRLMSEQRFAVHQQRMRVREQHPQAVQNMETVGVDVAPIVQRATVQPAHFRQAVEAVAQTENHQTAAEYALYDDLRHNRLGDRVRLEQDRIPYAWLLRGLTRLP